MSETNRSFEGVISGDENQADRFAELRGDFDPRIFVVPYDTTMAIEAKVGQCLLDEQMLSGATSVENVVNVSGKPILKALKGVRPVSYNLNTGKPNDVELRLSGQQVVAMDEILDKIAHVYGGRSLSEDLLIGSLVEQFADAEKVESMKNRIVFALQKLTRQGA